MTGAHKSRDIFSSFMIQILESGLFLRGKIVSGKFLTSA